MLFRSDKASQIVDLREGPDGTLFMIDWYDVNQCHNPRREAHDYTTGRIFRLAKKGQIVKPVNFAKMETPTLFKAAVLGEEWEARHGRRILQERKSSKKELDELWNHTEELSAIPRGADGTFTPRQITLGLRVGYIAHCSAPGEGAEIAPHPTPDVSRAPLLLVAQAIHNAAETAKLPVAWVEVFHEWAGNPSPVVRLALASACQRLTVEQRKPIVLALLAHEEDKDDANLPLMDWYAAEPIVAADPAWAAEALAACKIPKVAEFIARRMSEK